jgi:hypothetical protein
MKHFTRFVVALLCLGPSAAWPSDPAADLCDRGGGASVSERVENLISFTNAITRKSETPGLKDEDIDCVTSRLAEFEPLVVSYCSERSRIGHDLAISELQNLESELRMLDSDCLIERSDEFSSRLDQTRAETCADLANSFLAFADLFRVPPLEDLEYASCVTAQVPIVVPSVLSMCDAGDLAVRSSWVEVGERIARVCQPSK